MNASRARTHRAFQVVAFAITFGTVAVATVCCHPENFAVLERATPLTTLPIEVLGAVGTSITVPITIDASVAARATRLSLTVHGLGTGRRGGVAINDGAIIPFDAPTVDVAPIDKAYGALAGGRSFARLTLPLPNHARPGANTLVFTFLENKDGWGPGFRVLALNLLDDGGTPLLTQGQFQNASPTDVAASGAADIAAGLALWQSAPLVDPASTTPLRAHCSDCHADNGADLQIYGYSNVAIVSWSRHMGLSDEQGRQIAAYVRSLPFTVVGRPWNPPYQPGQATPTDSDTSDGWAIGQGLPWVLDNDSETFQYLFPNGFDAGVVGTDGSVDLRHLPIALQLPDWNRWLPRQNPVDSWPQEFLASSTATGANTVRAALAATPMGVSPSAVDALNAWDASTTDFFNAHRGSAPLTSIDTNGALFGLRQWMAVKLWSLVHDFDLATKGKSAFGDRAQTVTWPFLSPSLCSLPPQPTQVYPVVGDTLARAYAVNGWYQLCAVLQTGNHTFAGYAPIAWKDALTWFNDLHMASLQAEPARMLSLEARAMQDASFDAPGGHGWNLLSAQPYWLALNWPDSNSAGLRKTAAESYLRSWLAKNQTIPLPAWRQCSVAQHTCNGFADYDPAYVPGATNQTSESDLLIAALGIFATDGLDCQLLTNVGAWAATLWPKGNWRQFACPP